MFDFKNIILVFAVSLVSLFVYPQSDPDTYLKAQLDYEIFGVKKHAYEQEALRNRGTGKYDQYYAQSAEFAKKQGQAYEILVKQCNYDEIAKPPAFSSKKECEQYRIKTRQKLDEYYRSEREYDQQRPCYDCNNFDLMNKYIAWVNKLWPVKYQWIPLYKRKLELCNCSAMTFTPTVQYDNQGRRIVKPGDFVDIEGRIGRIAVEQGSVYYNEDTKTVEVPYGAKAKVVYNADNVSFNLKSDSKVRFDNNHQLSVTRGDLHFKINKRGDKFLIKTPTAVTGARFLHNRGAPPLNAALNEEIILDVQVRKNISKIYVYQGEVMVTNNVSRKILGPGEMTSSSDMNQQIEVLKFNPDNPSQIWKTQQSTKFHAPSSSSSSAANISGNGWEITKIPGRINAIEQPVNNALSSNKTPLGFSRVKDASYVIYLNDNPFNITSWNINWYNNVTELEKGITSMMNQGWLPMGMSFTSDNKFYIFYVQCDLQGTAWQITESSMDLQQVEKDVEPYLSRGYVPVGISVYGNYYYTLLIQFPDGAEAGWTIEGYSDNNTEIKNGIENNIASGMVPFGFLKEQGVVNLLFVGF